MVDKLMIEDTDSRLCNLAPVSINSILKQHNLDKICDKFPHRKFILYTMYILKIKHNKRWIFLQWMLKDKTLLCISCSICPTIYLNKHLSRLTYGRSPAKGSSPIVTRNRHITGVITYNLNEVFMCQTRYT